MAITSEIIGKLGGSENITKPVNIVASGSKGSEEVVLTIEASDGETWLVVMKGELNSHYGGKGAAAQLVIGSSSIPESAPNGQTTLVHVGTGTIKAGLRRNGGTGTDYFTGQIYAAKM